MDRVCVLIDYQNMHLTARDLFTNWGQPAHMSLVDPLLVSELIVEKRSRKRPSELAAVRVFRGRPVPEHEPHLTGYWDRQKDRWELDTRVKVVPRALNYRGWPSHPPREKGVDVAFAIELVRSALGQEYDAYVAFTADTDLLPALELAFYGTKPGLEIATWTGKRPLWFKQETQQGRKLPYCHFLNRDDFDACRDRTDYRTT